MKATKEQQVENVDALVEGEDENHIMDHDHDYYFMQKIILNWKINL